MSYTTRVFVLDRGLNEWKTVANIFASNPHALTDFLYSSEHALDITHQGQDFPDEVQDELNGCSNSCFYLASDFLLDLQTYYDHHPWRYFFRRKYVEKVLDIIEWFAINETDGLGLIVCVETF